VGRAQLCREREGKCTPVGVDDVRPSCGHDEARSFAGPHDHAKTPHTHAHTHTHTHVPWCRTIWMVPCWLLWVTTMPPHPHTREWQRRGSMICALVQYWPAPVRAAGLPHGRPPRVHGHKGHGSSAGTSGATAWRSTPHLAAAHTITVVDQTHLHPLHPSCICLPRTPAPPTHLHPHPHPAPPHPPTHTRWQIAQVHGRRVLRSSG